MIIEITCSPKEKQSSTQTPDVVPYTAEKVEKLLDPSKMKMETVVANKPLLDRENARKAAGLTAGLASLVEDHLAAVLTKSLNSATEDALRTRGALHKLSNGVECLFPSLVWAWANENHTKLVGKWLIEYFGSDANMNPKTFEEATLYFEGLLNHAYRQLKKTPLLNEYFDGADHIQENIKELIVHPREVLRVEEPSSLSSLGSEELYNKLQSGQAVYSKNVVREGGDILIPLMLSEGKKKATLYLFCAQCKLAKRVDNLQEVETKAVEIPAVREPSLGE